MDLPCSLCKNRGFRCGNAEKILGPIQHTQSLNIRQARSIRNEVSIDFQPMSMPDSERLTLLESEHLQQISEAQVHHRYDLAFEHYTEVNFQPKNNHPGALSGHSPCDTACPPRLEFLSLEPLMGSGSNATDLLFGVSNPSMDTFSTIKSFDNPSFQPLSSQPCFRPKKFNIPRSPKSNRHCLVDYFLKFHLEVVSSTHYFLYYDYIQLCKRWLPAMTIPSIALQYAVVAFSALVYSIKFVTTAQSFAFFYYGKALTELQLLLDGPLSSEECNVAIATALQLSSFDVSSQSL